MTIFDIDDGIHLPHVVIDEDASTAAGAARYRAECSCGYPAATSPSGQQALAAHIAHVKMRLRPLRGPAWLPVRMRVVMLWTAMMLICAGCYAVGEHTAHSYNLIGGARAIVLGGSSIGGYVLAFALMITVRRFIAPTREARAVR